MNGLTLQFVSIPRQRVGAVSQGWVTALDLSDARRGLWRGAPPQPAIPARPPASAETGGHIPALILSYCERDGDAPRVKAIENSAPSVGPGGPTRWP